MDRRRSPLARLVLCLALAALPALAPAAVAAQEDFLFRRPAVSLTLRGGYAIPQTGNQIFEDITRDLFVEESDFNAASIGGELAWRATERLDVALSVDHARSETSAEYRDWVDLDDNPIVQTASFERTPAMLSVKGYLFERGRSVSRFAWVPTASWSPYAGVGAGLTWYSIRREGDFVDFETLDILFDRFVSDGRAPTAHVLGGATFHLGRRVALTAEGRYAWARSADLDPDFAAYESLDLGGFNATAGISLRF